MAERYKINTQWLRGVSQSDQEALKRRADLVLGGGVLLDTLAEIVRANIDDLENTGVDDYDSPSWAYKEADRKGQLRALRNILKLTKRTEIQ